jgi:branched-chain amino acid transport system ATP-binding protein
VTETETVLQVADVSVRFGGISALSGVSIAVRPATIVGLIGPNGAGKTTLFSVISGLRFPDAGRVLLSAEDITRRTPQYRSRRGLARTFQHPELFGSLTIREHLVLAHRIHQSARRMWTDLFTLRGFRSSDAGEADSVTEIIDLLGLARVADAKIQSLPLGLTRLVEVGQAIATRPRLLLLDEPSAGLNPQETDNLGSALRSIFERREIAMVLVEHDLELVLGLSSNVYVLDFGIMICSGTPNEIRQDEAVRAAYLGLPIGEGNEVAL